MQAGQESRTFDPLVAALVSDENYTVRGAAAVALSNLKDPRAISYLIKKRGIPLAEYTPLQIKSCVTGFGGANKNQMTSLIPRLVKIDKVIKYDDEFDAIAVAITHSVLGKKY